MRAACFVAFACAMAFSTSALAQPVTVALSKRHAKKRAYPKALMRGVRDALRGEAVEVIQYRPFARMMRRLKIPKKKRRLTESLLKTADAYGAAFVIDVSIRRKRRAWVATTRLVDVANEIVVHRSTTRYTNPRQEARDRGRRIGKAVLRFLVAPEVREPAFARPKTPPSEPVANEAAEITDSFASASEAAFFGDEADASAQLALDTTDDLEPDALRILGFDWTIRGYAAATYRGFFHPDLEEGKNRNFAKVGLRTTLTGRMNDNLRIRVLPRIEFSLIEPRLHRAMIEEAFVEYATSTLEMRLGFDALTWGVASTVNIADVINARDFSEGFADAPKVGQPMLSTRFFLGNHSLTLIYMTPFSTPRFAPPSSPFSPYDAAIADEFGNVVYGARLGAWHPQAAARLELAFGDLAVRGSYFYGYRRTPIAHQATNSLVFPLVHNASIESQILIGDTTLKLETASIWHQRTLQTDRPQIRLPNGAMAAPIILPDHRIAWVAGIEHKLDVADTSLLLVTEFFGDSHSELFTNDSQPDDPSRFLSNHAVVGFRWLFNNHADSRLDVSDIFDLTQPNGHLLRVEYAERRFERWTFVAGGQLGIAPKGTKMATFNKLSGVYTEVRVNY